MPPADVLDAGGEYRVVLEVPGATRDAVDVTLGPAPGTLAIKIEVPTKDAGAPVVRAERGVRTGSLRYHRIMPVAHDADCTNVKTSVADGILTISVPKMRARFDERS